jgi:hypothetical protein
VLGCRDRLAQRLPRSITGGKLRPATALAASIHEYKLAFTTIEVIHVAAVSPVISTIAIVDLRLLGFASTKRPLTELTRAAWTWAAIAVAAVSGALLFISRATEYTSKTVFQVKLLVMLITGIAVLFVSLIGLAIWLLLASAKALEPDDTRHL